MGGEGSGTKTILICFYYYSSTHTRRIFQVNISIGHPDTLRMIHKSNFIAIGSFCYPANEIKNLIKNRRWVSLFSVTLSDI